jgi:hypothetical protein
VHQLVNKDFDSIKMHGTTVKKKCCEMASPEKMITAAHQIILTIIFSSILSPLQLDIFAQIKEHGPTCKIIGWRNQAI